MTTLGGPHASGAGPRPHPHTRNLSRLAVGMTLYALALAQAGVWIVEGRWVEGAVLGLFVVLTTVLVARSTTWRVL